MQALGEKLTRSVSVKAAIIGLLVLVLLIPVSMIEGVIHDRQSTQEYARNDIKQSWGREQLVAGPVLVIPYTLRWVNDDGEEVVHRRRAFVLPSELSFATAVDPEVRRRGIYEVPIYSADIEITGRFPEPDFDRLGIADAEIDRDSTIVVLAVADTRAIAETPEIRIGGRGSSFEPGGPALMARMPYTIFAPVGDVFGSGSISFSTALSVKGSDTLQFAAIGDSTQATMRSSWQDPGFYGSYLPDERDISDSGFSANWRVSGLGRDVPSQWTSNSGVAPDPTASAFGVSFYMPVSPYQVTLRAASYAILFIGLSFVAYFLFEVMIGLKLHPLQYLQVGFANALFYLLLISLAEHIGFGIAYLISAAASTSLIAGYSAAVLGARRRGLIMAAVLVALYGLLYITLNAETYALLGGAIGLWATLAVVMYLTRRIDWYAYSSPSAAPATD